MCGSDLLRDVQTKCNVLICVVQLNIKLLLVLIWGSVRVEIILDGRGGLGPVVAIYSSFAAKTYGHVFLNHWKFGL